MELKKFDKVKDINEIFNFYNDNGYVIISELIQEALINDFINAYTKFKQKGNYLINAQDTNRPERLKVNNEGYIENSIMDPLDMVFAGNFPDHVKSIVVNSNVQDILKIICQSQQNVLWQSMFFDKSTGTVIHQDSYYLDTDPPGKLVGAWFALEDIHEDAGVFYICPKAIDSSKKLFGENNHSDYVKSMLGYVKKNNIQKLPCPLKKGDVLFWNSLTLHGAFENTNPSFSRKSFTSHFLPKNAARNNTSVPNLIESDVNGLYLRKKNSLIENIRYGKVLLRYLIETKLTKKVKMEMKSEKY